MNASADNQLTGAVIGAAIDVHRQLGPGLEEEGYEEALSLRLTRLGIEHETQVPRPLVYKGVRLDCGYRLDVLVQRRLPLELKAVNQLLPVHDAQLLTYMRIGKYRLGLLINFDVELLKNGIRRKIETRELVAPDQSAPRDTGLSSRILAAAIEIHRHTGPGLLASSYEECLCYELVSRGLKFERKKEIALRFDGSLLKTTATIPLIVEGEIPVFPISTEQDPTLTRATALARLRQGNWKVGLVLNFNSRTMAEGIQRLSV